jgi:hypothetical protein
VVAGWDDKGVDEKSKAADLQVLNGNEETHQESDLGGDKDGLLRSAGHEGGRRRSNGEVACHLHRRRTLELGRGGIPRHVTGPIGEALTVDTLTKQDEVDLFRVEAERTERERDGSAQGKVSGVGNVLQIRKQLTRLGPPSGSSPRDLSRASAAGGAGGYGGLHVDVVPPHSQRGRHRRSSVENMRRTLLGAARIGVQAANLPMGALRELTKQIKTNRERDRVSGDGRGGRTDSLGGQDGYGGYGYGGYEDGYSGASSYVISWWWSCRLCCSSFLKRSRSNRIVRACQNAIDSSGGSFFCFVITIYALFGDDARLAMAHKDADPYFFTTVITSHQ